MTTEHSVLITGASGFIGSAMCRYLAARDYRVVACLTQPHNLPLTTCYTIRLPDPSFVEIVRRERPKWLIHCAGSASVQQSLQNPDQDFVNNVLATESVLQALAQVSPETRFIFLSSGAVYGQPDILPITEQTPTNPISTYGFHKLICELICRKYHLLMQIPTLILRVFSAYGPGLKKQLLWDIYQQALVTPTILLYGSGMETRDFIYIDDIVRTIHVLMDKSHFSGSLLNIASGQSIRINQIAMYMAKAMGSNYHIQFRDDVRNGDPVRWEVDITVLRELDLIPGTSLEEGVQRYIHWLRSELGR